MLTVTAAQFNQHPSEIRAMSEREPVFVTDCGRTTTVVLSTALFDQLRGIRSGVSVGAALVADDDVDLDIVRDRSLGYVPDIEK